jgi:L-ascorbate metabolism protein UlaG (beta-lactamase superfamily)
MTTVQSLGNAGFAVRHGEATILLDPVFLEAPAPDPGVRRALILVTHEHWDHLSPDRIAAEGARLGATVVGPRRVIRQLQRGICGGLPLLEMEPPGPGASVRTVAAGIPVTAVRTVHGQAHNSYLVELPGFRFLHDGDNEDTGQLNRALLADLDALMIAPWQGSGWVDFIEGVRPRRWFLMHMSDEELDQHERGEFFPDLCDHVPAGLIALRPGQSWTSTT